MPTIRSWIRFSITDQFVCTAVFFSNVFNREAVRAESRSEFVGDFRAYRYVVIVGVTAARPARPPFLRDRASSRTVRHHTLVTRPAFSTPSELQTRTEYSTIHRTQTHRTEGRSFESTTTSPLWIPFVSPHAMRGVHEPHSYFSVPSHDVHSRTPLSP